ncbi:MAG: hypothetical protein NTZ05_19640, partial [Chloroflexi bacterium]|nr:hypothetical protein [Chloroflexota bacterium]
MNATVNGLGRRATGVTVTLGGGSALTTEPAAIAVDDNGAFTANFAIPVGTALGAQDVNLRVNGAIVGVKQFIVRGDPAIQLDQGSGPGGSAPAVTGRNWTAGTVTLSWDIPARSVPVTAAPGAVSDSTGFLSQPFTVPVGAAAGQHLLTATQNGSTATAVFVVTAPPSLAMSPQQTAAPATLVLTGRGFRPSVPASIAWDTTATAATTSVVANAAGGFPASVNLLAGAAAGSHLVTVSQGTGADAVQATATVTVLA